MRRSASNVAVNVDGMLGKVRGEIREEVMTPKIRSGATGSRFAQLEVNDIDDEMEMEGAHGVVNEASAEDQEAEMEPKLPANVDGVKNQAAFEIDEEEDVDLGVSHVNVAEGLKSSSGPDLGAARGSKTIMQRLTKQKVLKEVTNKLVTKPAKLKPA